MSTRRRLNEYPATTEPPAQNLPRAAPSSTPPITGRNRIAASPGRPPGPTSISAFVQLNATAGPSPFRGRRRSNGPAASARPRAASDGRVTRTEAPRPTRRNGPAPGRGASAGRRGRAAGRPLPPSARRRRAPGGGSAAPIVKADSTRVTPGTPRARASARSTSAADGAVPRRVTTPARARTSIGNVPSTGSLTSAVRTRAAVRASATAADVFGTERALQPAAISRSIAAAIGRPATHAGRPPTVMRSRPNPLFARRRRFKS